MTLRSIPQLGRGSAARSRRFHESGGFTLIETLIVVALVAMMAVLAVPWFIKLHQRYMVKSAAFEIQSSLMAARMRAVNRNTQANVTITVATGPQEAHEIDITELPLPDPPPPTPTPIPYSRSYFIAKQKIDFVATPQGGVITFGGDGRMITPIPTSPTPGANIVIQGPAGARFPNQITIETDPSGRVLVITPLVWN